MIITSNNIRFTRLKEDDIELVRKWRNHPSIKKNMVYRDYISPEMQKKWFASINNNNNLYFIIEYKEKKIGLINGKDIDWEERTMETGIFIWNKYYRKSHIPTLCSMIFAEIGISLCHLKPMATILKNNEGALKYNKMLGFKVIEDDPEKEYVKVSLDKENMNFISRKLTAAVKLFAGDAPMMLIFEKEDLDSGLHDLVKHYFQSDIIKKREEGNGLITYYF